MKLVFLGNTNFSVAILESLVNSSHRIMAVATSPDKKKGRGLRALPTPVKSYSISKGLQVFTPLDINEHEFVRQLRALSSDLVVVAAYGQKLSRETLTMPRYYCVNVHPSLLPKYRGPSPIAEAILNGDRESGVTIIRMTEKMDAGPILAAKKIDMPPDKTTGELEGILAKLGGELLIDLLGKIQKQGVSEVPQDEKFACYTKKLTRSDGWINWNRPAKYICNFVRAMTPYPGAYITLNNIRLKIRKVREVSLKVPGKFSPAVVATIEKASFHVSCQDGALAILELQPEGKRPMSCANFMNGYRVRVGDVLK